MSDFGEILSDLKNATGIDAAVFTVGGQFYGGDERLSADFLPHKTEEFPADGVLGDEKANKTYFLIKKGHTHYVGVLSGCDTVRRNYAILLRSVVENAVAAARPPLTKAERFRLFLRAELDDTQLSALKSEYAGASCDYYMLTLVTDNAHKLIELRSFLDAIAEAGDIVTPYEDKAVAYFKKCGTEEEYQSANDFACTLYDNIKEELRINIVINVGGTAHSFDDLLPLFRQCSFAYSFGRLLSPAAHIYSYKEYIMIKLLSDIPKPTLLQYLDSLLDKNSLDILSDDEMMNTAEEFLKNSLNISETSRSMYMHRNTLIYRLDKIENATGLNLRHFNDAVVFKQITVLHKLTQSKP